MERSVRSRICPTATLSLIFIVLTTCAPIPTPALSAITPLADLTPTPKDPSPPLPTTDAAVQPFLENVEAVLRHSAVVVRDRAVGIPDACPGQYLMAFPYTEPDRRGGMTIAVTGLNRREDGSVVLGEHQFLWGLKGEGMDPERCKDIYIQDLSEPGLIRISFQVQHPDDRSWRIGVASGPCPGIELWLAAYFTLHNPDDFELLLTQYDPESRVDYWLRDGNILSRYQWEPWRETLLWKLEDAPGKLLAAEWNQSSPDRTGDGKPDLALTWQVDGEKQRWIYASAGSGFTFIGMDDLDRE